MFDSVAQLLFLSVLFCVIFNRLKYLFAQSPKYNVHVSLIKNSVKVDVNENDLHNCNYGK